MWNWKVRWQRLGWDPNPFISHGRPQLQGSPRALFLQRFNHIFPPHTFYNVHCSQQWHSAGTQRAQSSTIFPALTGLMNSSYTRLNHHFSCPIRITAPGALKQENSMSNNSFLLKLHCLYLTLPLAWWALVLSSPQDVKAEEGKWTDQTTNQVW